MKSPMKQVTHSSNERIFIFFFQYELFRLFELYEPYEPYEPYYGYVHDCMTTCLRNFSTVACLRRRDLGPPSSLPMTSLPSLGF